MSWPENSGDQAAKFPYKCKNLGHLAQADWVLLLFSYEYIVVNKIFWTDFDLKS
jgi:hypothetical protein